MSPKNHQIINKNLDQLYQNVANIARLTADKITNLIQNFGGPEKVTLVFLSKGLWKHKFVHNIQKMIKQKCKDNKVKSPPSSKVA